MKSRVMLLMAVSAFLFTQRANAGLLTLIDFDEFSSPPVTCCYSTTGVNGPLVYPDVTVIGAGSGGAVMNGDGWSDAQTSGDNLFGSISGFFSLTFNSAVTDLSFDVISGSDKTVSLSVLDATSTVLFTQSKDLTRVPFGPLAVNNFSVSGVGDIWSATIRTTVGSPNFAIDTIAYRPASVPSPATFALVLLGLLAMRQRAKECK